MRQSSDGGKRSLVESEFIGADFGDARLSARLVELARRGARAPENRFPKAAGNSGELEATYRFLSNERVCAEAILAPHVRETVRRSQACEEIVVAHDTSEFNFGKSSRKDLARVGLGKSFGFYGHVALAVEANEARAPLGVLSIAVHQRHGKKSYPNRKARQTDPTNEGRRWG